MSKWTSVSNLQVVEFKIAGTTVSLKKQGEKENAQIAQAQTLINENFNVLAQNLQTANGINTSKALVSTVACRSMNVLDYVNAAYPHNNITDVVTGYNARGEIAIIMVNDKLDNVIEDGEDEIAKTMVGIVLPSNSAITPAMISTTFAVVLAKDDNLISTIDDNIEFIKCQLAVKDLEENEHGDTSGDDSHNDAISDTDNTHEVVEKQDSDSCSDEPQPIKVVDNLDVTSFDHVMDDGSGNPGMAMRGNTTTVQHADVLAPMADTQLKEDVACQKD